MTHLQSEFLRELLSCLEQGTDAVAVTLIDEAGHIPQDPGAKMIVTAEGRAWGTVGGGKVEARAVATALDLIAERTIKPRVAHWNLQTDLGMSCGGSATLLFEGHIADSWNIIVFGAGHIAQALIPILSTFACQLTVVDHRSEWTEQLRRNQRLRVVQSDDYIAEVTAARPGTFYVICTRGHATDLPVLEAVLRRGDAGYVGVVGSVTKGRSLRAGLLKAGLTEADCEKFQTPMGLAIGNNAPGEIAVSIAAKLLQVRDE